MADDHDATLVNEILAKHRNSRQPESVQLCAVLGAVVEVTKAEGLQPTPTALYGALMSALERPETRVSGEVSAPWDSFFVPAWPYPSCAPLRPSMQC